MIDRIVQNIEDGEDGVVEIGVKRFHLPFTLVAKCPTCGEEITHDLDNHYLSYPAANTRTKVTFWHYTSDEDHEWTERIILRLSVEAAPPETT